MHAYAHFPSVYVKRYHASFSLVDDLTAACSWYINIPDEGFSDTHYLLNVSLAPGLNTALTHAQANATALEAIAAGAASAPAASFGVSRSESSSGSINSSSNSNGVGSLGTDAAQSSQLGLSQEDADALRSLRQMLAPSALASRASKAVKDFLALLTTAGDAMRVMGGYLRFTACKGGRPNGRRYEVDCPSNGETVPGLPVPRGAKGNTEEEYWAYARSCLKAAVTSWYDRWLILDSEAVS